MRPGGPFTARAGSWAKPTRTSISLRKIPILLQIIRRPLALQLLQSGLPLSLVGSPLQAILLPVRFAVRVACSPPQLYPAGVQYKTILTGSSSRLVVLRLQDVPRAN